MNEMKQLVENYIEAIHTQNEQQFRNLWSKKQLCTLISVTKQYKGIDEIYHNFLIGRIHESYKSIQLVQDGPLDIRFIDEKNAIIIFSYHTKCIKRDTLEKYGIKGLETQIVTKENNTWKLVHLHYSK
ncbi:MAG: hypothetical protein LUG12_08880 [Erysipelotrichaceae bacterium]|nr:hypothetical protein [Erysipelotrichaceae bacterium]